MAARRFDTDTLLEQLLEHKENAFKSFYERYRGRVYRFIVRQGGNGEEGQLEYLAIWANMVDACQTCTDTKSLKLAFLQSLQRPRFKTLVKTPMVIPFTLMPRELEEEGGWSTLLVEMVRRLPEGMRKRLLFRYEIGLSYKAIATIFDEDTSTTQGYIEEAERELHEGLVNAGCKLRLSLESVYRETRSLKPPLSWDQEVLSAYPEWIAKGVPEVLLNRHQSETGRGRLASMKAFIRKHINNLRADLPAKTHNTHHSIS